MEKIMLIHTHKSKFKIQNIPGVEFLAAKRSLEIHFFLLKLKLLLVCGIDRVLTENV